MKKHRIEKPLPVRYIPRRAVSLASKGVLTRDMLHAAAMFCYYEEHEWLLYTGVGSNFPTGYKVQSSMQFKMPGINHVQHKPGPLVYDVLRMALIENLPFAKVALAKNLKGSPRTLHRKGLELFRRCLKFYEERLGG